MMIIVRARGRMLDTCVTQRAVSSIQQPSEVSIAHKAALSGACAATVLLSAQYSWIDGTPCNHMHPQVGPVHIHAHAR